MSTAEFAHNGADLGGLVTVQPDSKTPVFPARKTTGADPAGVVSVRATLGADFTSGTHTQLGTLTQSGSTLAFSPSGISSLISFEDDDLTVSHDGSFGDVSVRGIITQNGAKSFADGVDPLAFESGATADDDNTLDLNSGEDAATFSFDGELKTLNGQLIVDPLLLEAEHNPNKSVIFAPAVADPTFDLDDTIRLNIFAGAGLSGDPAADFHFSDGL